MDQLNLEKLTKKELESVNGGINEDVQINQSSTSPTVGYSSWFGDFITNMNK